MPYIFAVTVIGLGATLLIDLWAFLLRHAFNVRSLDYCLLGRWVLHMPAGRVVHENIAASTAKTHECAVGWTAHYSIGIVFALLFGVMAPEGWFERPTLLPALLFGIATVIVPFFTLQPSFGLGMASSKTPAPNRARVKSLMTHTVFGLGLYVWAYVLSRAA